MPRNNKISWKVIISRDFVVLLFLDTFDYGKCPETGELTKFFQYFKGFCHFTVSDTFEYGKCLETGELTKFFEYFKGFCFTVSRHFWLLKVSRNMETTKSFEYKSVWKPGNDQFLWVRNVAINVRNDQIFWLRKVSIFVTHRQTDSSYKSSLSSSLSSSSLASSSLHALKNIQKCTTEHIFFRHRQPWQKQRKFDYCNSQTSKFLQKCLEAAYYSEILFHILTNCIENTSSLNTILFTELPNCLMHTLCSGNHPYFMLPKNL